MQPHSPVAQPWPVVGSYLVCCGLGLACAQWIQQPQLGASLAVALSIWLMVRLDCIHPPGAALAMLLAMDGPLGADAAMHLAAQLGLDVGTVLLSTMLVSRLVLRRPYPYTAEAQALGRHQTSDAAPMRRIGLVHADLASAVKTLDTFVDVQEDELVEIYNLAVDHAFGRHVGLTCADIMSRDVITAHFDTALAIRLQGLLRRTPGLTSQKAEVVGQIMTAQVFSATPETPIASLVAQMTDQGVPHIPVIDAARRVVGMVTQSDLLAALYKRIAVSEAQGVA